MWSLIKIEVNNTFKNKIIYLFFLILFYLIYIEIKNTLSIIDKLNELAFIEFDFLTDKVTYLNKIIFSVYPKTVFLSVMQVIGYIFPVFIGFMVIYYNSFDIMNKTVYIKAVHQSSFFKHNISKFFAYLIVSQIFLWMYIIILIIIKLSVYFYLDIEFHDYLKLIDLNYNPNYIQIIILVTLGIILQIIFALFITSLTKNILISGLIYIIIISKDMSLKFIEPIQDYLYVFYKLVYLPYPKHEFMFISDLTISGNILISILYIMISLNIYLMLNFIVNLKKR